MADREVERTVEVDPATMARIRAALQKSGRLTEDGVPAAFEVEERTAEPETVGEPGKTEVREVPPPATPPATSAGAPDMTEVREVAQRAAPVPAANPKDEAREVTPPSDPQVVTEARPNAQEIPPSARTPKARPVPAESATPVATVRPATLQQGARWELPTAALDPVPKAENRGSRVWPWMLATFMLLNAVVVLAGVVALGWGRTPEVSQDPDPASVQINDGADEPDVEPQSGGLDE